MYNSQEIALRIKETAKKQGIVIKEMLSDLEINVNTISMLAKGREISYMNFAKIADYLNCSVDYLLCKTDDPTPIKEEMASEEQPHDPTTDEFIELFRHMKLADRVAVMQFAFDKMEKTA